jgi:predicted amidohydrolase
MITGLKGVTRNMRVAAGQFRAYGLGEANQSLIAIERLIEAAALQAVELLVLPECAYPAYLIESADRLRSAGVLSYDEFAIFLARFARKKQMAIIAGCIQDLQTELRNSAVMIGSDGQVRGTYSKSFLWGADNRYFAPGDRTPVFDCSGHTVGMVICADTRAPEILAVQSAAGAGLIAMPTCWVNVADMPDCYENPQPEFLISARAREFNVPFVCANKYGMETDTVGYCGRSLIVDASGTVIQEAPGNEEALLVADIDSTQRATCPYEPSGLARVLERTDATRTVPRSQDAFKIAIVPGQAQAPAEQEISLLVGHHDVKWPGPAIGPQHTGSVVDTPVGRVGCVNGTGLTCFESARHLALDGMEILAVVDAEHDLALLRTRAIENRTFVVAVGVTGATIVAPDGTVLCYKPDEPGTVVSNIRPADAAVKLVAAGTDIWEQRRPQSYRI